MWFSLCDVWKIYCIYIKYTKYTTNGSISWGLKIKEPYKRNENNNTKEQR